MDEGPLSLSHWQSSLFPQFGSSAIFNGTLSNDMKIGHSVTDFIKSQSGIYHLGVMYQGGLFGKIQVVPVLVVDSISSGVYDTIIPDLSTSWQDYVRDNSDSTQKTNYDFDYSRAITGGLNVPFFSISFKR